MSAEDLQTVLAEMLPGRPVILRGRLIPSGFTRHRAYPHYYLTLPRPVVESLGWKPGLRLVPYYSREHQAVIFVPAPILPPT